LTPKKTNRHQCLIQTLEVAAEHFDLEIAAERLGLH
jgi:hypothetical protein